MAKLILDEEILKYAFVLAIKSGDARIYVTFCQNVERNLSFLSDRFLRSLIVVTSRFMRTMDEIDRVYWKEFYRKLNRETYERERLKNDK